jgi:hypothetical protein
MIHQGRKLEKYLASRDIKKGIFANMVGMSVQYVNVLLKNEEIPEKWKVKIIESLDITSNFFNEPTEGVVQLAHGNGGDVHQSVGGEAAALREVIAAKNEVIASQNKQIALLEELLKGKK